ncbi:hypothetical protein BEP19_14835 [Ammoniphilus oxalaticus]|uniref:DUF5780 domain-containing protein n=1 Tax=Ammoniphilus oxalaticus TaxID=66863 RepID=A0A419SCU0_9BACL|nr:DUF5780 domain-containing protein [Ammoniphilus oxalaticus]RKD20959.1 hypothetical protein BEP19_14835 [Ammoniphilus oxalaticus]
MIQRNLLFFISAFLSVAILTSCNKKELEIVQKENIELKEEVNRLETELSDLKNSGEIRFKQAVSEKDKGNYQEAIQILDSVIEGNPDTPIQKSSEEMKNQIAGLIEEQTKQKEDEYNGVIEAASNQKSYDDSIEVLNSYLKKNPEESYKTKVDEKIKEYKGLKNKPPLELLKSWVTFNSIGNPEARIRLKNITNKSVDAFDVKILTFDNYNQPVNHYLYKENIFSGVSQDIINPGITTGDNYYWTLHGHDNTTKIKTVLVRVHFTDDSVWENPNWSQEVEKQRWSF